VDLYTSGADGDTYSTNSVPDLLDYRAQVGAFAAVAGYTPMFAGVMLLIAAMFANAIPAYRAVRIDPVAALRDS
jgi:hypothetical protein